MDKEIALRTFGYLIGYYKTHDEAIINSQEIEAIEFMLKDNEDLEQQCKKQKKVIDKAIEYINENKDKYYQDWGQDDGSYDTYLDEYEIKKLLDILKEVSE